MSKDTQKDCETCDYCVYIGEGDFICDKREEPELVIENWQPVRMPCGTKVVEG